MDKLFLIDGHSLIFRMYYAFLRRPMINSKGEDTSILFGFTKYLLELIRREHPTHLAIAFDPPAKTFRHELSADYKATREAAPELVKEALEPLCTIAGALRIPVVMKPGYEADDVIGTLAKKFCGPLCDVYMVTPDKDLGQIVDDHIYQYKPGKSGADNIILSKADVCANYGIGSPSQVIDILTLWGDASDNVKGVPGVGEIGAGKFVAKYGSVENIFAHLGELTPRMQESFRSAEPYIYLSKELVTIKTDVPLDVTFDSMELDGPDPEATSSFIKRYEFGSLRSLLPEVSVKKAPENEILSCTGTDFNEIKMLAEKAGMVAVRHDGKYVLGVGSKYCVCDSIQAGTLLGDPSIVKAGHSMKGVKASGDVYDIELMHYLAEPERTHKLDILARSYLNADIVSPSAQKTETVQEAPALPDLFSIPADTPVTERYDTGKAGCECAAIWKIVPILKKELHQTGLWELYLTVEMPLMMVLADMEATGVTIDTAALRQYGTSLSEEMAQIEAQARESAGESDVNLSSPRQVGNVIFEKLALNPRVKKSGLNYPTDEETLRDLEGKHPFIGLLLEYRGLKKLLSTYVEPLPNLVNPATGKIHTTFNQALTATGRLSSSHPNLQNIPIRTERGSRIREAFVSSYPDGCIISADYSQIELRIMAHLSGDEAMLEGFSHGADIHTATAARIFGKCAEDVTPDERRKAKAANFGIIYGMSAFGLAQRMEIPRGEAKAFIEEYFRNYPGVKRYIDEAIAAAHERQYVETMFGRRRYLPEINSRNHNVSALAERNAINAPIQGSAADIIKMAMINVWKRLREAGLRTKMVLQVHDELIFDVAPGERDAVLELVRDEMEHVCTLKVPLTVECNYGRNWKEAH